MDNPKRALLKVSGEKLSSSNELFHRPALDKLAKDIALARENDWEIALLVGGGNIIRGREAESVGMKRVSADWAGMIATIINGLVLKESLLANGMVCEVFAFTEIPSVCDKFSADVVSESLSKNGLVILSGGTGNPFFTTDTAACLRAAELGIDRVLKGTKVDGVFSSDPHENEDATFFPTISYDKCLANKLEVMDSTAICLARESHLDLVIFNLDVDNAINKALNFEIGTHVIGE